MRVNPQAADALGTLGAVCWSVQLVPQIIKSYRSKSTEGLSAWLMVTWAAASVPLGTYNIVRGQNVPLIIQPQMFAAFCSVSWAQCLYYSHKFSKAGAACAWLFFLALVGLLELAFYFACRAGEAHGTSAPTTLFGVLSAVMILGGLVPQYYEIWKYKAVIGISLIFIFVDLLGALFSCLSLIFQERFDVLASVAYGGLALLEVGIFVAAAILNPRMRRKQRLDGEMVQTSTSLTGRPSTTSTMSPPTSSEHAVV